MAAGVDLQLELELIKPSSPTPRHLKHFKFSLLDQIASTIYVNTVFFYRTPPPGDGSGASKLLPRVKNSLSNALALFYPFAGRISGDGDSVDCNDRGVPFLHTFAPCSLIEMIGKQNEQSKLVPSTNEKKLKELLANCPLIVQVTFFQCGGTALSVSISHKVADASSVISFVTSWARCGKDDDRSSPPVIPDFSAGVTLFPPIHGVKEFLHKPKPFSEKCVTRTFFFNGSKITRLINEARSRAVPEPTRVQSVSAFLWKCAMRLFDVEERGCVLRQGVNLRRRLDPPLQDHTIGNLVGAFEVRGDERNMADLGGLVGLLTEGLSEYSKKLKGGDDEAAVTVLDSRKSMHNMHRDGVKFYSFTSWCKFPFYEVDFGWGKPCWVCPLVFQAKNVFMLMDAKDGQGIQAWVTLLEKDMALFEKDQELLTYATEQWLADI